MGEAWRSDPKSFYYTCMPLQLHTFIPLSLSLHTQRECTIALLDLACAFVPYAIPSPLLPLLFLLRQHHGSMPSV
jgi:hypothetical protein